MKLTKEEFRERLLYDLNERKKQKQLMEEDIEFYFRKKITKYRRAKMNRKKR